MDISAETPQDADASTSAEGGVERLADCRTALLARGVKDVKFCWALNVSAYPASVIRGHVCNFIDAYLDGRSRLLDKIGDAPCTRG